MISDPWTFCALLYVSGVLAGTILGDAGFFARVGLALAWPLGPLAFAVTLAILLVASAIAFPAVGAVLLAAAGVAWLLL